MGRLIDLTLAPLYTTVGIGDMLTDRAARRQVLVATREHLDNVAGRGRNVTFDALTGLPVIGATIGTLLAHDDEQSGISGEAGRSGQVAGQFSLLSPLTSPLVTVSSLTRLLRGPKHEPRVARTDRFGDHVRGQVDEHPRPKRTAASRTFSPAPSPHRQPVIEQPDDQPPLRMTGSRTVRPSGMEAASTATRAARRAALRAEQQ